MNVLEGKIIGWRFWYDRGVHLDYPARGKSMSGILLCRFVGGGGERDPTVAWRAEAVRSNQFCQCILLVTESTLLVVLWG